MFYFEPVWKFREKGAGQPSAGGQPASPPAWSTKRRFGGHTSTQHLSPDKKHALTVVSHPDGTHHVTLYKKNRVGYQSVSLRMFGDGRSEIGHHTDGVSWDLGTPTTPASPELRHLANGFHQHEGWAPLLDKMQEEYPDHFAAPVQAHTNARNKVPKPRAGKSAAASSTTAAPSPAQPPRPQA